MTADLRVVVKRLERVEVQNRRMKIAGLSILFLVGSALLMGQTLPPSDTLEARELILRDHNGDLRVGLYSNGSGLILFNRDGDPQVQVEAKGSSPGIVLRNAGSRAYMQLHMNGTQAQITLADRLGQSRVRLNGTGLGPALTLFDDQEKTRLMLDSSGTLLRILRRGATGTSNMVPIRGDEPGLAAFDASGNIVWSAP